MHVVTVRARAISSLLPIGPTGDDRSKDLLSKTNSAVLSQAVLDRLAKTLRHVRIGA